MNTTMQLYESMGNDAFSAAVVRMAPYFATIDPVFTQLRPGYAELTFPDRHEVRNHIGTVHAIALCNGAELAAGTMTSASLAFGRQWIPVGMTVKYQGKAKTDMRFVANGEAVDWDHVGDIEVPVEAYDTDGKCVFSARITMNLR
jgi:acyl-coenzyme A thioesterase PaaI-like protein